MTPGPTRQKSSCATTPTLSVGAVHVTRAVLPPSKVTARSETVVGGVVSGSSAATSGPLGPSPRQVTALTA
ncbi:MAG TPA: hypothetical protein VFH47_04375 [Candidatus Thermoplasmatota archaeon]|nr:hypothetical protein [Candidatus Thermoplasmatota archaeon]